MEARRAAIVKSITDQGKMTDDLARALSAADTKAVLEDIYLPFKPKRRTKAMIARENGLEPLLRAIFKNRSTPPEALAADYLTEAVPGVKEALEGARDILVEELAENAALLGRLRDFMRREAFVTSRVIEARKRPAPSSRTTSTIARNGRASRRIGRSRSCAPRGKRSCASRSRPIPRPASPRRGDRRRRHRHSRPGAGRRLAAQGGQLDLAGEAVPDDVSGTHGRDARAGA
jgi:hypothetical protein